mgnify:CR=1 FL=1
MSKPFLVCIDSDGCAFDTMEIKHKECFCPSYINYFGLQAVSKYARDAWDFANLYSCWRGVNRFLVLLKSLDLLSERKEVLERKFKTPMLPELRKYVAEGRPLNNAGIEAYLKELMEKELMRMDYRIKAEADYGYIPIKEDIDGYEIVDIELEESAQISIGFGEHLDDLRARTTMGGRQFAVVYNAKSGRQSIQGSA